MPVEFRALQTPEVAQALQIRIKVFVEEQKVPLALERDEADQTAQHFGIFLDSQMVGTGRLLIQEGIGRIGRLAVLKEFRKKGLGSRLIQGIMAAAQLQGIKEFVIGAQLQALDFYAKLGFKGEGDVFLDGGLPHRTMRLRLD